MKEQLITFETAKLAKEKGFNESTEGDCWVKTLDGKIIHNSERHPVDDDRVDNEYYLAQPTQSLLQKWLRDEHNLYIDVHSGHYAWNNKVSFYTSIKSIYKGENKHYKYRTKDVSTYEESLEKALIESLKLIK